MKECFKNVKEILAICWGMQVAVTAAGGEIKKGIKGSHIGIANDIELTKEGISSLIYKDKKNNFNTPAFNFDEVIAVPADTVHLASNKINKIQALNFKAGVSEIWGLQYHPEITYQKMIDIIKFRKDSLIKKKNRFKNEEEINNHINFIEEEIKISKKDSRMLELRNWLNLIN
jgi:GMP synthase (glutamine-hydrolysing)